MSVDRVIASLGDYGVTHIFTVFTYDLRKYVGAGNFRSPPLTLNVVCAGITASNSPYAVLFLSLITPPLSTKHLTISSCLPCQVPPQRYQPSLKPSRSVLGLSCLPSFKWPTRQARSLSTVWLGSMPPYNNILFLTCGSVKKTSKYADLLIRCAGREWKAYRLVVCLRSRFFEKACEDNFKVLSYSVLLLSPHICHSRAHG